MPTVLVTGAGRGIGLELARQYAADGWQVVAATRARVAPASLASLAAESAGRLRHATLDAAQPEAFAALATELAGEPLDVVVSSAGVLSRRGFGHSDWPEWETHFRVNAFAPMRLAETLLDNLLAASARKFIVLTSLLGSIGENRSGGMYAYRASKAAANAIVHALAIDLAPRGVTTLALHPGWVRTAMGGPLATLEVGASVAGLRRVIAAATVADSGQFLTWNGERIPW